MSEQKPDQVRAMEKKKRKMLSRSAQLYKFSLPHWRLMLVATLAAVVYTSTMGALLFTVKPLLEAAAAASERTVDGEEMPAAARVQEYETRRRRIEGYTRWLPSSVRNLIKKAMVPGPEQLKSWAIVIGLIFAPLIGIFAFLHIFFQERVQWVIIADMRAALFAHLVRMPVRFFDSYRIGELISRMTYDVRSSQVALKFLFGDIVVNPLRIVIYLSVAVYYSWRLALLCFVVVPLIAMLLKHFGRRIRRHAGASLKKLADLTEAMNQMFSGIRVVKAFQMEGAEIEEFNRENARQLRQATRVVKNRALSSAIPEFLLAALMGVLIWIGSGMLLRNTIEWEDLIGFTVAAALLMQPIRSLSRSYSRLPEALAATERVFDLIEQPTLLEGRQGTVEIEGVREGITYRNVWFAYQEGQPVLRDVNFTAPAGKTIAVVGETGSGKSTLLDLIPRFHEPTKGAVLVDGVDIREIERDSLISQIAMVGQHPFLFNRSIRQNILYGRRGATQEEVEDAARKAGIHKFIQSLPEKYETSAGERGGFFSGGQRQCITIARAILKDAPILLLDEATSNLDAGSEKLVHEALSNLMKGRTTFVIAHRLSTVREADIIVVLKQGCVIETGGHEELLEQRGEYYRLYTLQFTERPEQSETEGEEASAGPDGS